MSNDLCIPFVAGIIERIHDGKLQLLIQTRYFADFPNIYNGTIEFAAGMLDKPYENVYDALAREIEEETGLTLKKIIGDNQTEVFSPQKVDAAFGFRPFCCVQQLKEGRPWVGFVFRCEVEDGEPRDAEHENQNVHWEDLDVVKKMFEETPEKFFTLQLPAWEYYFREVKR